MPVWQALVVIFLTFPGQLAWSRDFNVVHDFLGIEGADPSPGLLLDGSTLYGAAGSDGAQAGTIFKLAVDGSQFTVIHQFTYDEGPNPNADFVLDDGTLYGTTAGQGSHWYGSVFKVKTDGSHFQLLKTFTGGVDGNQPSSLVRSGTFLYGTTFSGGSSNLGTVFRIGVDGSDFAVLKHFTGSDGAIVNGGLVVSGSVLYGTTMNGGQYGNGALFRLSTNGGNFALIKSYGAPGTLDQGTNPSGRLGVAGDTLYGTTINGPNDPGGTVFKVHRDGSGYQVLHTFTGSADGSGPSTSLVLDHDTLYGTTLLGGPADSLCPQGCGTVFKVRTDGTGFATLRSFSGKLDGGTLLGGPLTLTENAVIGTTHAGGSVNKGVLFAISRPRYPEVIAVTSIHPGNLLAVWSGSPGTAYDVLSSNDLNVWTPLSRVTSDTNGIFSIADVIGDGTGRFFRATIP